MRSSIPANGVAGAIDSEVDVGGVLEIVMRLDCMVAPSSYPSKGVTLRYILSPLTKKEFGRIVPEVLTMESIPLCPAILCHSSCALVVCVASRSTIE